MTDLYKKNILDHFKHPRNSGVLKNASISHTELNSHCGDEIHVYINIEEEEIQRIQFEGKGCAISQAAMSLLTEKVEHKNIHHVLELDKESVFDLLGVVVGKQREKCALLSLLAIQNAILLFLGKKKISFQSLENN